MIFIHVSKPTAFRDEYLARRLIVAAQKRRRGNAEMMMVMATTFAVAGISRHSEEKRYEQKLLSSLSQAVTASSIRAWRRQQTNNA